MGPRFFVRNYINKSQNGVTITVTDATAADDGQGIVDNLRDGSNNTGWGTVGSDDAALTTIEFDFGESQDSQDIIMVDHNFKSFKWQRFNGAIFVDIPGLDVVDNQDTTSHFEFGPDDAEKYLLIIRETFVADDDKFMAQVYITKTIGQFQITPFIEDPEISRNRREVGLISGAKKVFFHVGTFSCNITFDYSTNVKDLEMVEALFDRFDGFHVWLNGGDPKQFRTERFGFRLKDIFLVICRNEYKPRMTDNHYKRGTTIDIRLVGTV